MDNAEETERRVKCRWCTWKVPVWWRTKTGRVHNGFDSLVRHCEEHHPRQVARLRRALDEKDGAVPEVETP